MSASLHPAILKARQQSQQSTKMSTTQTFYLAHKARGKLSSEAAKSDHNLRLLVGHANLLDSLMLHLQNAEREQDAWFNAMVRGNSLEDDETDVMDTISEEEEEESSDSEISGDDGESDYELDADFVTAAPKPSVYDYRKTVIDVDEIEVDDDFEEEEDGFYTLRRTQSHAPSNPPELIDDDDSDSESMPPSPPQPTLAAPVFYEEKSRKQINTASLFNASSHADFEEEEEHYYQSTGLISAF